MSKKGTRKKSVAKTKKAFKEMFPALKLLDKITIKPDEKAMGGYMNRNDGGMAQKTRVF